MEQIKHVNLEKSEFEQRVKPKIIAPARTSDHQASVAGKKNEIFLT